MIDRRIGFVLTAAALAAVAPGCALYAAKANVKSNKSADYAKKLDRTLIVFAVDDMILLYEQIMREQTVSVLQERMVAALQQRGVTSTFARVNGSLDLEGAPLDKHAKDLDASTALFIRRVGGTATEGGRLLTARFDAQLFDLASKNRVWRASIDYDPGNESFSSTTERADTLVGELVKALANDGLL